MAALTDSMTGDPAARLAGASSFALEDPPRPTTSLCGRAIFKIENGQFDPAVFKEIDTAQGQLKIVEAQTLLEINKPCGHRPYNALKSCAYKWGPLLTISMFVGEHIFSSNLWAARLPNKTQNRIVATWFKIHFAAAVVMVVWVVAASILDKRKHKAHEMHCQPLIEAQRRALAATKVQQYVLAELAWLNPERSKPTNQAEKTAWGMAKLIWVGVKNNQAEKSGVIQELGNGEFTLEQMITKRNELLYPKE